MATITKITGILSIFLAASACQTIEHIKDPKLVFETVCIKHKDTESRNVVAQELIGKAAISIEPYYTFGNVERNYRWHFKIGPETARSNILYSRANLTVSEGVCAFTIFPSLSDEELFIKKHFLNEYDVKIVNSGLKAFSDEMLTVYTSPASLVLVVEQFKIMHKPLTRYQITSREFVNYMRKTNAEWSSLKELK